MKKLNKELIYNVALVIAVVSAFSLFADGITMLFVACSSLINGITGPSVVMGLLGSIIAIVIAALLALRFLSKKDLNAVGLIVDTSALLLFVVLAIVSGLTSPAYDGSLFASPIVSLIIIMALFDILPRLSSKKVEEVAEKVEETVKEQEEIK